MPKGGKRAGAGRPLGSQDESTIRKRAIRERILAKFEQHIEELAQAQVDNAMGLKHFYLRDPKTQQFVQITDPKEIEVALNCGKEGEYYWIHTKVPSTQAFTALSDRAIDKPVEPPQELDVHGDLVIRWGG
jgi:hypothetical protein